jgi:hypothetical protein
MAMNGMDGMAISPTVSLQPPFVHGISYDRNTALTHVYGGEATGHGIDLRVAATAAFTN